MLLSVHKSNILPYNLIISFSIKDAMEQKRVLKNASSCSMLHLTYFLSMVSTAASLDEIAQLADMHKSNIFYYYENKEALYVEVLTTVMQKWLAPLQSLESRIGTDRSFVTLHHDQN